jgi:hypothetical protein
MLLKIVQSDYHDKGGKAFSIEDYSEKGYFGIRYETKGDSTEYGDYDYSPNILIFVHLKVRLGNTVSEIFCSF